MDAGLPAPPREMKAIKNFIGWLVPGKEARKHLRNRLIKTRERRKALLAYGCRIEGDIAVSPDNIRFDISDHAKIAAHIGEILVDEVYSLNCNGEAIVIDIGMNRGIASLYFAAKDNIHKVYGFEPFGPTRALAQRNLDLNPALQQKIEIFEFGLGKADTTLEIPYSESVSDLMSTTHPAPDKRNLRNETVEIRDAAAALGPILERHRDQFVLVKCDCEGAEFEIMERLHAENLVGGIDALLMEYHFEEPARLIEILTAAGFAVNVRRDSSKKTILGLLYAINMHLPPTARQSRTAAI